MELKNYNVRYNLTYESHYMLYMRLLNDNINDNELLEYDFDRIEYNTHSTYMDDIYNLLGIRDLSDSKFTTHALEIFTFLINQPQLQDILKKSLSRMSDFYSKIDQFMKGINPQNSVNSLTEVLLCVVLLSKEMLYITHKLLKELLLEDHTISQTTYNLFVTELNNNINE